MASKPSAEIRLAPSSEPGASLYNSYHYLTQIAGLYAQAARLDHRLATRNAWLDLSDSALQDLGEVFQAWEMALKGDVKDIEDQALSLKVERACLRAARVMALMNVWTPHRTWSRIMGRLERKWAEIASIYSGRDLRLKERLAGATSRGKMRRDQLVRVAEILAQEERSMAAKHPGVVVRQEVG